MAVQTPPTAEFRHCGSQKPLVGVAVGSVAQVTLLMVPASASVWKFRCQRNHKMMPSSATDVPPAIHPVMHSQSHLSLYSVAWRQLVMIVWPSNEGCTGGHRQLPPALCAAWSLAASPQASLSLTFALRTFLRRQPTHLWKGCIYHACWSSIRQSRIEYWDCPRSLHQSSPTNKVKQKRGSKKVAARSLMHCKLTVL